MKVKLQDNIHEVDAHGNGANDAPEVVTDGWKELVEAVKVFDRGPKGIIVVAELRSVMTYTGEKLDDEEGDEVASWSSSSWCRYQSATSR